MKTCHGRCHVRHADMQAGQDRCGRQDLSYERTVMNRKNNEKFIVLIDTFAAVGLILENIVMGWEFWVPAVVLAGVVSLWAVSLSERIDYGIKKIFYFSIAALMVFYHGVHKTSLFDTALVVVFVMILYSLLNSVYMLNALSNILLYFLFISSIFPEEHPSYMTSLISQGYCCIFR